MIPNSIVFQCFCFVLLCHINVIVQCNQCVEQTDLEMLHLDKELHLDDEEMQEFEGGEIENHYCSDPCVQSLENSQNISSESFCNHNALWDGSDVMFGHCRNSEKQKILSKGNVIRCGVQNLSLIHI